MVSPRSTEAPPAAAAVKRSAPTTARLQKRKLTLAEAAEQWEKAKVESARQKGLQEEAAEVLLGYFERSGRAGYKGRIGWTWRGGSLVLDQPKVRAFLGQRLEEFQKRSERVRSLTLLR